MLHIICVKRRRQTMQSAVSVTTLKGLSQTNNLETIITLVQSALAQFLITRGGSGFSQVNACCTWGQVSYDTMHKRTICVTKPMVCQWKIPHHTSHMNRWSESLTLVYCTVLQSKQAAYYPFRNYSIDMCVCPFHCTLNQTGYLRVYYVSIFLTYATNFFRYLSVCWSTWTFNG